MQHLKFRLPIADRFPTRSKGCRFRSLPDPSVVVERQRAHASDRLTVARRPSDRHAERRQWAAQIPQCAAGFGATAANCHWEAAVRALRTPASLAGCMSVFVSVRMTPSPRGGRPCEQRSAFGKAFQQ